MKTLISTLALVAAAAFSATSFAASHGGAAPMATDGASAPMGKQQSKMGSCNAEAKDMKGEERKTFMKTCLSTKKPATQQDRMKNCNADAAGKKGDERKGFMKECLSAK